MMMLPFPVRLRVTLFTLTLMLPSSCALIQDEPFQVAIVSPQQAQLVQVIYLANSDWPAIHWWEAYDDSQLNMLINRALRNSPIMQAARLHISQSQSTVEFTRSAMGLQAIAVAAQNCLWTTDKSFSWPYSYSLPVDRNGPWHTLNTVSVRAQLNIDLWGADRVRVVATIGEKNARLMGTADIESDITGSMAQPYFAMQATFQKIVLLQELEGAAQFLVTAYEYRTQHGVEGSAGVANARAEQLVARQQIISAEGMLTQYRGTLRALIGADTQSMPAIHPVALPALQETLPSPLFFELPVCRSDLQALRGHVTASLSQTDAAKTAFCPRLDIKAFWGYNALSVGDLFKSFLQQINLLSGLYLSIFDGGRLNANLQLVRTASNVPIKQHSQAVLDAVCDVVTSSSQLNDLNQQCAPQQLKVIAAQTTIDSARVHYQRSLLSRYAAEEVWWVILAQQLLLLDIEAQRLSTDITLIKALGGDYRGQ